MSDPQIRPNAANDDTTVLFETLSEQGQTVIMVTHEPDIAAHARRVVVLRDGEVSTDETQSEFRTKHGL